MAKFTSLGVRIEECQHLIAISYHLIDRKYWTADKKQDRLNATAFLDAKQRANSWIRLA
jgi:hypothetical protein